MSNSLWPHGLYSPWNSPGQNTGVGSLSLLQGIIPTQGWNLGLPHCRRILYQLSHQGSPQESLTATCFKDFYFFSFFFLKQDKFITYSSMDQNREWVLQAKINMVPELCSSWKSWVEIIHSSFPVFSSHHIRWFVVSFSINITSSSLFPSPTLLTTSLKRPLWLH